MQGARGFTLHDAVFRQLLSMPDVARDFITLHLPPDLLSLCDLATLRLESGQFVEENLQVSYGDILWSLMLRHQRRRVYVLIEHQSSADRQMAFRLMHYALSVMQRCRKGKKKWLPLVIPILFYQGKGATYPYSLNWLDTFSTPQLASRFYGASAFLLVDIGQFSDDEIMTHRSMALLTLLQKHIRQHSLEQLQERLVTLLLQGYTTEQQLTTLINYMLQAGQTRNPGQLIATLAARVPAHKETLMTIAEWLREEGRIEGHKKGHNEGIREATRQIAIAMLNSGLAPTTVSQITGLSEQALTQLQREA